MTLHSSRAVSHAYGEGFGYIDTLTRDLSLLVKPGAEHGWPADGEMSPLDVVRVSARAGRRRTLRNPWMAADDVPGVSLGYDHVEGVGQRVLQVLSLRKVDASGVLEAKGIGVLLNGLAQQARSRERRWAVVGRKDEWGHRTEHVLRSTVGDSPRLGLTSDWVALCCMVALLGDNAWPDLRHPKKPSGGGRALEDNAVGEAGYVRVKVQMGYSWEVQSV